MRKIVTILLMIFGILATHASCPDSLYAIVVDAETGMCIKDACVRLDNGRVEKTAWNGSFVTKDDFKRATISCLGYMARKVDRCEFSDTITLVSTNVQLGEVIVMGIRKSRPSIHFKAYDHTTARLIANSGKHGFNLLDLFPSKKKARREEVQKNLSRY